MPNSFEKYQKRRLRSSYVSVVFSISLVLFVLGVLGMLVLKSSRIAEHFQEQVTATVFLKETVNRSQVRNFEAFLKKKPYTKSVVYVSKEKAARLYSRELGEDFLSFLGTNPLKNSVDIRFHAAYVKPAAMDRIKKELLQNTYVTEVIYDASLIHLLSQNIQKISFWVSVVIGFFTLISMVLINSSIRLSVYSKRFTIKTMQMVGATKAFIRRPFIWKSIRLGMAGALLAIGGLACLFYSLSLQVPSWELLSDLMTLLMVFGGVFVTGILVTWISAFFATQRFLNLKTDELYD